MDPFGSLKVWYSESSGLGLASRHFAVGKNRRLKYPEIPTADHLTTRGVSFELGPEATDDLNDLTVCWMILFWLPEKRAFGDVRLLREPQTLSKAIILK